MSMTTRRVVLTGAVTAITVVGVIYGAGLKMRQERTQEQKKLLEATPEQQIVQLEAHKRELLRKKAALEEKISDVRARKEKEG